MPVKTWVSNEHSGTRLRRGRLTSFDGRRRDRTLLRNNRLLGYASGKPRTNAARP
jgi:hypothetical protein